jgi:calcium-dependent protein kinase
VKIHKSLDHPNIVKMYEYFRDENRYYMIIEIISGGELYQKIKSNPNGNFSEHQARIYMRQIL